MPGRAQGKHGSYEFVCSQARLNDNIVVEDGLTTLGFRSCSEPSLTRAQDEYGNYEFACSQAKLNDNIIVEDELTTFGFRKCSEPSLARPLTVVVDVSAQGYIAMLEVSV